MSIPIFTYHSLNTRGHTYDSDDHLALESDLATLKRLGFRVERLTVLVDAFNEGSLSKYQGERVCAISFDDGVSHDFVDFYHPDRGLLKSFARVLSEATEDSYAGWAAIPATSFVIVSPDARDILDVKGIAGRNQWHDHWWQEAIQTAHFDIGNHSWDHTHPLLPDVVQKDQQRGDFFCIDSADDANGQIIQAEAYLEKKLGNLRSRLFAYPYGHVSAYLRDEFFPEQANTFRAAFATGGQYFNQDSPRWAIPRFVCGEDWESPDEFEQILAGKGGRRKLRARGLSSDRAAAKDPVNGPHTAPMTGIVDKKSNESAGKAESTAARTGVSGQATTGGEPVKATALTGVPFFLVGCVRSGTTLLRDLLRDHPSLICPEETHLFRWPHPFGSGDFMHIQRSNGTLKAHRGLDGVADEDFEKLLENARSRRDLQDGYAQLFCNAQNVASGRWFDKTPQNVYGMLLLSAVYPRSSFVHIVRHPFNVIASLKAGKVMAKHTLIGAINTWLEAVSIVRQFESAWPDRIVTIRYEDLTEDPQKVLNEVLEFLDEAPLKVLTRMGKVHSEQNKYRDELSVEEVDVVREQLLPLMQLYGYD